ncbi:hypothetical protein ACFPN7_12285 [Amycolatopsis halotolerans]|uniref:hypothetical protein n=1 Tax=Amycolatopsis halotolerans TaxID=330083 RepID=UPI0036237C42
MAQEVAVGQQQHPRSQTVEQVVGQGGLAAGETADGRAEQLARPAGQQDQQPGFGNADRIAGPASVAAETFGRVMTTV